MDQNRCEGGRVEEAALSIMSQLSDQAAKNLEVQVGCFLHGSRVD